MWYNMIASLVVIFGLFHRSPLININEAFSFIWVNNQRRGGAHLHPLHLSTNRLTFSFEKNHLFTYSSIGNISSREGSRKGEPGKNGDAVWGSVKF
ncbi:MAG: hypothetical protein V2A78_06535 [bacterium]